MKKFIILIALMYSFTTQATLLELDLDKTQYQQGETIELQLVASDLSSTLGQRFSTLRRKSTN